MLKIKPPITLSRSAALFHRAGQATIDIILPPQSLLSGELSFAGVEGDLWASIWFLDEPCCEACGFPFDFDQGSGALCARCVIKRPAMHQTRSAFAYDDYSRRLILSLKHGGRTEGLPVFGRHMQRAGRRFWPSADLIIPVPLHYTRLIQRRFNQSALLARTVAKHVPAEYAPHILKRIRATPSQGGQTAAGRRRNVRGSFAVTPKRIKHIKGKHIVLIDDVMTTGATLEACARTLKRAGAARIDALTLARVVRGSALPT